MRYSASFTSEMSLSQSRNMKIKDGGLHACDFLREDGVEHFSLLLLFVSTHRDEPNAISDEKEFNAFNDRTRRGDQVSQVGIMFVSRGHQTRYLQGSHRCMSGMY